MEFMGILIIIRVYMDYLILDMVFMEVRSVIIRLEFMVMQIGLEVLEYLVNQDSLLA